MFKGTGLSVKTSACGSFVREEKIEMVKKKTEEFRDPAVLYSSWLLLVVTWVFRWV